MSTERSEQCFYYLLVRNPYQMQRVWSIKGWAGQIVSVEAILLYNQVYSVNRIPSTVQRPNSQD